MIRYAQTAKDAGCPRAQLENLIRVSIILQPAQLKFAAACRECDQDGGPTEVGFGGARMGGKSHAMLAQLGADDCVRHPGLKCLLLRKVGGAVKESFEALLPKTIGSLGKYIPTQSVFRFDNGSFIKLGHFQNESDVDKYLGLEYDVVAIEEATTLSSAKKQSVQSCCRSPAGSGWRARMYNSTNPGGVGHAWYKQQFVTPARKGIKGATRFIPSTVDDNAYATAEYRSFLDGLTGWLKRAWRYGDWDIAAGQYFTTFLASEHVIKPFPIPDDWRVWMSLDYGFTHYTVAHLFAKSGDGQVFVVDEHGQRGWIPERHSKAFREMLAKNGIRKERIARFVAGGDVFRKKDDGRTIADEYKRLGWRFRIANMDRCGGAAEILRRLGDVSDEDPKKRIRPSLHIFDRCVRLAEDLPAMEHDPNRPEDVLKVDCDESGLGGDDFVDSFRYGLMVAARTRKLMIV